MKTIPLFLSRIVFFCVGLYEHQQSRDGSGGPGAGGPGAGGPGAGGPGAGSPGNRRQCSHSVSSGSQGCHS